MRLFYLLLLFGLTAMAQERSNFYRNFSKADSLIVANSYALKDAVPNNETAQDYFDLAMALWEKGDTSQSEKMLRVIMDSDLPLYNNSKSYASDIPGDTTQNTYGYGSFTYDYKNRASRQLAKILIDKGNFEEALSFAELAKNTYKETYNCGTGYGYYNREMEKLFGLCYEGLGQYEKVIELLFKDNFDRLENEDILARALKKIYTTEELEAYKTTALGSIEFTLDDEDVSVRITAYGSDGGSNSYSYSYRTGLGTVLFFDKKMHLPTPSLEKGETATHEDFVEAFTNSVLYDELYPWQPRRLRNRD